MIKKNKLTDFYKTSDLSLATVLSLYFPINSIDRTDQYKAYFLFKRDNDELDQMVEAFWRGELRIDPQMYFNQLKAIKSRLYAERSVC